MTPYRVLMVLLYAPFLFVGFLFPGFFLYGRIRLPGRATFAGTWFSWSLVDILVMILPLVLMLAVQYIPLLLANRIVLVGPGGMFVLLVINIAHIIGVLLLVLPISAWLFLLSGRPYLGALVSALLVAWMFASSQVIAPVPIKLG